MRRRLVLLFVLLLALAGTAQAWSYLASEAIVVAATAIGPTATKVAVGLGHPAATGALCTVETAAIRYTIDGTTPTASVGFLVNVGQSIQVNGTEAILNLLMIRTAAVSAGVTCIYSTP